MPTYLTFNNKDDAQKAVDTIWYNIIIKTASNEEKIIMDDVKSYLLDELKKMDKSTVCKFKICGKKNNVINYKEGFTIKYSEINTSFTNENLFFFIKPDESLMENVINYTESEKDDSWWDPNNKLIK